MAGYTIRLHCEQCIDLQGITLSGTGYSTVEEAERAMGEIADIVVPAWSEAHTGHNAMIVRGLE